MSQLVFEKSITRDWGLLAVQIQHAGLTKEFDQQFGWRYTEVAFEGTDGHISLYRAPVEHIDGMRAFLLDALQKNPNFVQEISLSLRRDYQEFRMFIEQHPLDALETLDVTQLRRVQEGLVTRYRSLLPRFILLLWFPQHLEDHPEKQGHLRDIELAIDTRKETEGVGPLGDDLALRLGRTAAQKMSIPDGLGKFLSQEETVAAFAGHRAVALPELEARASHYVYGQRGLMDMPLSSYLAEEGFALKQPEGHAGGTDVKGMSAFEGIARGRVRVLFRKTDIPLLQTGEILVMGMTTPEFLPAMKKAAAFVTDEGGITCHAAIVARELKKPCIIGTKIATQVLKDGDEVEVDANKGIVRVVKRAYARSDDPST